MVYRDNWKGAGVNAAGPTFLRLGRRLLRRLRRHTHLGGQPPAAKLGGQQHLPSTTAGLISYVDGTKLNGCLYTGPTMIEFVKGGTMNVWSPSPSRRSRTTRENGGRLRHLLPREPLADGYPGTFEQPHSRPERCHLRPVGAGLGCELWLPDATDGEHRRPDAPRAPGRRDLHQPYYYNLAASSSQCIEGDAIVEGELQGQVTLATSADIIVSRDLTYECADGSGGATATDPSSVAACNSASSSNDVLGLLANEDFLIAHPVNGGSNDPTCTDDGTESNPGISNVVPCRATSAARRTASLSTGAVVSLNGSTYVPNFTVGAGLGNLYENGTNINYYPGSTVSQAVPVTTRCSPTTPGSRT